MIQLRVHELKIWPDFFATQDDEQKPFEIRERDRDFRVGDYVVLREFYPEPYRSLDAGFSGRRRIRQISHIMQHTDLPAPGMIAADVCILGLRKAEAVPELVLTNQTDGAGEYDVVVVAPGT